MAELVLETEHDEGAPADVDVGPVVVVRADEWGSAESCGGAADFACCLLRRLQQRGDERAGKGLREEGERVSLMILIMIY